MTRVPNGLTETIRRLWINTLNLDAYFSLAIRLPTTVHERECKHALMLVNRMVHEQRAGATLSSEELIFFYGLPRHTVWEYDWSSSVNRVPSGLEIMDSQAHVLELTSLCRGVFAVTRAKSIETQESIQDVPSLRVVLETVSTTASRLRVHQTFLKWWSFLDDNYKPFPSLEMFLSPDVPSIQGWNAHNASKAPRWLHQPSVSCQGLDGILNLFS